MTDIATLWNQTAGDWTLSAGQLLAGGDLETAVLISIFTNRQASADDVIPDGTQDPRGWWGDLGADRPIGSKLWLRMRSKQTAATLAQVRGDIAEALQWLLDDGVVARVDVFTEWTRPGMLGAKVTLYQHDGARTAVNFSWAWQGIA